MLLGERKDINRRNKLQLDYRSLKSTGHNVTWLIHTYHAVPLPCRTAKGLDCLSHLMYIVRPCLIHTCHAAPMPCHDHAVLKVTSQVHGSARHGYGMACLN
jgi:hypothetical protein